jgi:hypothetical protein
MAVEINISDIRLIVNRILDHIEHDLGRSKVAIHNDDYWEVSDSQRYIFSASPSEHTVGKLTDDWEFLSAILDDKQQAVSLMLVHAAPLLREIGEQVGQ